MTRSILLFLAAAASFGCGSSAPPEEPPVMAIETGSEETAPVEEPPVAPAPAYQGRAGNGTSAEDPIKTCGAADSYAFVAQEFRCPDGTNPLGGDADAGARARVGNVGSNSSGHVIDHYQVPCPSGPADVYVDMYGCPEMEAMLRSYGP